MNGNDRFELLTIGEPYIFVISLLGQLSVQHGLDEQTKVVLSDTDVVHVSAIRGWRNVLEVGYDQGLICGYIKSDGFAYYRSYSQQPDGEYVWEVEHLVSKSLTFKKISLFRTNDYRVGFILESNDNQISWVLTTRAWAGMAIEPENISIGLTGYNIDVVSVTYIDAFDNAENIGAGITNYNIGCAMEILPVILNASNLITEKNTIKLKFNYPIEQSLIGHEAAFTLKDSEGVSFAVVSTAPGVDQTELILTTDIFSSAKSPMTIAYANIYESRLTALSGNLHFAIESGTTPFTALIAPTKRIVSENVNVGLTSYAIATTQVYYKDRFDTENVNVGLNAISLTVTKVGDNPL